jgi:uncharacterized protein (DUF302 family)
VEIELSSDVRLPAPFDRAIERVTEALKEEGFGVLTRIDVHSVLREKLGATMRSYAILGACNPQLAHRALSHDPRVGLLLPCNITVEATSEGETLLRIGNPEALLAVGGLDRAPELKSVAEEARARLQRVADSMRQRAGG